MKHRRRTRAAQPQDPLLIGALVFTFLILTVDWTWKIILLIAIACAAIAYVAISRKAVRRITQSGIHEIDQMTGIQFEQRLFLLFQQLGYHVEATPPSNDYGADLIATSNGVAIAIQAKCYKKPVNNEAVQEATTAKAHYRCTRAMVVTNSTFTKNAKILAFENDVELWDREKLIQELARVTV